MHDQFKEKKPWLGEILSRSDSLLKGISLCQRKYYVDLSSKTWYLRSNTISTPTDPSIKLFHDNCHAHMIIIGYQRLIGRLVYLTTIKLKITFITQ